jgi:hypothetical protein
MKDQPSSSPIKPRDISVVMQGPVWPEITARGLQSIRVHLPGAEIILSTWKGADTTGLDSDVIVLNEDPGPVKTRAPKGTNVNRLLWSTKQGLQKAGRTYCLKFRTDMRLLGPGLLSYFGCFAQVEEAYRVFRERIVISSMVTWQRRPGISAFYHPSDMFGFGLTEDVRRWWNAPLFPFAERDRFETAPVLIPDSADHVPLEELSPEQYIWLSSLRRTRDDFFYRTLSRNDPARHLHLLLNNFIVVEANRVDVEWMKPVQIPFGFEAPLFSFAEYRYLYRKEIEHRGFQFPPLISFWKRFIMAVVHLRPAWHAVKGIFSDGRTG